LAGVLSILRSFASKPNEIIMQANAPIGIFDSGIGGLTVAKAVKDKLPNEQIIYFGDTAHLPYGDKSEAAIQAYCIKIADVLLKKRCKIILIACNSASSVAFDLLTEYTGSRAMVINVIDPMVSYISEQFANQKVGLIGTKRTIISSVYRDKLATISPNIELVSLATPLLVPMIEEGYLHNKISNDIIENYLSVDSFIGISGLILGCTHYPLIKDEISTFYKNKVEVIDSAERVADELAMYLKQKSLLSNEPHLKQGEFLISDYTDSFALAAQMFFQDEINVIHYPLWD
jgi:glutamate racemase